VRINAPGVSPKKETTSISGATPLPGASAPVPPPPSATRPLVPPPAPRPPAAPGLPPTGGRPGMPPIAPKPQALPPGAAPKASTYEEAKPVTIKASPKKETARIQVAPTQRLPAQATVRLTQPNQSLSAAPASAIRTAAPAANEAPAGSDTIVTALSWAAVAVSLAAAAVSYMAFSAAG